MILSEIQESEFYSIIFDETADVSNISQLRLLARFIYEKQVEEHFLDFVDCHKYEL